jgi:hypothetical protein
VRWWFGCLLENLGDKWFYPENVIYPLIEDLGDKWVYLWINELLADKSSYLRISPLILG